MPDAKKKKKKSTPKFSPLSVRVFVRNGWIHMRSTNAAKYLPKSHDEKGRETRSQDSTKIPVGDERHLIDSKNNFLWKKSCNAKMIKAKIEMFEAQVRNNLWEFWYVGELFPGIYTQEWEDRRKKIAKIYASEINAIQRWKKANGFSEERFIELARKVYSDSNEAELQKALQRKRAIEGLTKD